MMNSWKVTINVCSGEVSFNENVLIFKCDVCAGDVAMCRLKAALSIRVFAHLVSDSFQEKSNLSSIDYKLLARFYKYHI